MTAQPTRVSSSPSTVDPSTTCSQIARKSSAPLQL